MISTNIVTAALFLLPLSAQPASATDFTASVLMEKMSGEERGAYIAGLVDGLAQARWMHDGKQGSGSKCIHDWYYQNTRVALQDIYAMFDKYPSYPPSTIVAVLLDKKCPAA